MAMNANIAVVKNLYYFCRFFAQRAVITLVLVVAFFLIHVNTSRPPRLNYITGNGAGQEKTHRGEVRGHGINNNYTRRRYYRKPGFRYETCKECGNIVNVSVFTEVPRYGYMCPDCRKRRNRIRKEAESGRGSAGR